jgi:Flp pilus assembly protein TadG
MKDKNIKNKILGERGQALLELALILPILLMLIVGITEFGRAWMMLNVLSGAVREGARVASVTPDLVHNQQNVRDIVTVLLGSANLEPVYILIQPEPSMQSVVRVTAAVDFFFIPIPFVQEVFGEGYTMVRSASCYYEAQLY